MKEIRVASLRATNPEGEEKALLIEGMAIPYNTPTTIKEAFGEYTEVIRSGALDQADLTDSRLLYNHDLNKIPLARVPKTMTFDVGPAGLTVQAQLPDTEEGRSVYTAVKRGDLSGMSFGFKVPKDGSQYDPKTNTRTISKIEKIYEISIVPFPAYPTTSVEARSQIEDIKKELDSPERSDAKIKINQILKRRV